MYITSKLFSFAPTLFGGKRVFVGGGRICSAGPVEIYVVSVPVMGYELILMAAMTWLCEAKKRPYLPLL